LTSKTSAVVWVPTALEESPFAATSSPLSFVSVSLARLAAVKATATLASARRMVVIPSLDVYEVYYER
jgi:hypothetical protein